MPDFTVRGNPGAIRSRAATTTEKGQTFFATGEALSKIDVSGWTGRAADHFREAHDLEPDRWIAAGNGFVRAGNALSVYASAVERAQELAHWAQGEYARGEQVTQDARAAYDADVARGREQQARSIAHGIPFDLTIVPFDDPGQAIRDNALSELAKARSDLESAAHACAAEVRAGCAAAPEKPNWFESGLRFVGGIFEGAGEAVWDLLTLSPFSLVNMVDDSWKLMNGDLTPEELMHKYELSLETVEGMWDAMRHDPLEFGKNLGKGLLDWDTWSDDPARALGHLVPDAVVAALTAGTGGVAARGAHAGADGMEALADANRVEGAVDGLSHLDDLGSAKHLDGLGDGPPSGPPGGAPEFMTNKELADLYGIDNPREGMTVYRVFGEAQDGFGGLQRGSMPFGESWTPVDPRTSADFRWDAGLPDENPGRFYVEGILRRPSAVDDVRPALPLDGNPGGWPEYIIKNSHDAVEVRGVGGVNETWSRSPGEWDPP